MKKRSLILFCLIWTACVCNAEIIEIQRMNEVDQYLTSDVFILFDIDNTLIEPVQELGNDQWFRCQVKKHRSEGDDQQLALLKTLREWRAIQHITEVQLVEGGAEDFVANLQDQKISIIGLTTRGYNVCSRTIQQLESVGIDLSKTAPVNEDAYFSIDNLGVLYHDGILLTNGSHKGKAFRSFLEHFGLHPKHVLFINDKLDHLQPIEKACAELGISFTGLRYGYLDSKLENVRYHIADVQFRHFGQILSDEDAEKLLGKN